MIETIGCDPLFDMAARVSPRKIWPPCEQWLDNEINRAIPSILHNRNAPLGLRG
jgi:hypothetical protein